MAMNAIGLLAYWMLLNDWMFATPNIYMKEFTYSIQQNAKQHQRKQLQVELLAILLG